MPHYRCVWQDVLIDGVPQKFEAIEINYTDIEGNQIYLEKGNKKGAPYTQLRWDIVPPKFDADAKYMLPGGNGTRPFFPQLLKQFYESGMHYDHLVITEGAFKADVATKYKMFTAGLTSITHSADYRDADALHSDILKIIERNGIQRITVLWDGDCREISTKQHEQGKDLNTRPKTFFNQAVKIRQRLRDAGLSTEVYFAHILSNKLPNSPKGIDDLLLSFSPPVSGGDAEGRGGNPFEVSEDLFSKHEGDTNYFHKINISVESTKLKHYFNQDSVDEFYNYHRVKLKDAPFVYDGTTYQYDTKEGRCHILFKREAKDYMRIGDKYYRALEKMNAYGDYEKYIEQWDKAAIAEDYGKDIFRHLTKYKGFVTIPDHFNHKPVIDNCYNKYYPFSWQPEECDMQEFEKNSTTFRYLRHVFGANEDTGMQDHIQMFLDYFKLLYEKPMEKLPALCLVSTESNTGKSTMFRWLRKIFTNNMIVIGNSNLHDQFNATWSSKLLVGIDEALIEKQAVLEMIKSLMTEQKIVVRRMQKEGAAEDCFMKFILNTNNIHTFIYATKYEDRFWIRYVPPYTETDVEFEKKLADEIPQFLYYTQRRMLHYTKSHGRFWFPKKDYDTTALQKVVEASRSSSEKNLQEALEQEFEKFPEVNYLYFTKKDLQEVIRNNVGELEQMWKLRKALLSLGYPDMPNSISYTKYTKVFAPDGSFYSRQEEEKGRAFKFFRNDLFAPAKEKNKKEAAKGRQLTLETAKEETAPATGGKDETPF